MYKLLIVIVLLISNSLWANDEGATGNIEGKIVTAEEGSAEGVTINIKGRTRFAVADNSGAYFFKNIEAGNYTLVVTLVGHKDEEREISVKANETVTADFKLSLSDKQLSEVVIVSNKNSFKTNRLSGTLRLNRPILEIPQNVQVVTSGLIYNQQIFDMLEGVTRNVSGATRVEHWDNYARITMRGSNVAAFRNGMNVSTDWGPLTEDMSMVERIEFVKGPAGFMLANGDPSGFYNVVTKKPSGRNKGEVSMSLGSFDLYRATLDLDGKFSEEGKLLYRLNVMGQTKGSHRQFDYNNRYTIAPVLKYQIDDKTSATIEFTQQFSEVNVIGSNYLFSKRGYTDQPLNATNAEANLEPTKMNDRSLLVLFNHKLSNYWNITAQAAWFKYTQIGASLWPIAFNSTNDSLMQRGISIWDVLGNSKMVQMFVTGEAKTGMLQHNILAGVDMSNKEYYHDWNQGGNLGAADYNIYVPIHGAVSLPVFDRSKDIRERGVRYFNAYNAFYTQDEISLWNNKLRVTIAGRYTTLNTGDVYSGEFKKSKFTPRLGLSYSIDANTAVYFVNDRSFIENYGTDWQGKSFDPIKGVNLEAGIKRDWLKGKWNTAISVYQVRRKNVLTADLEHPNPVSGFYNRQSGEQETKGVELDIKGEIIRNVDVTINYAFTQAKVTKDSKSENVGVQLPGSSRHVNNAWFTYRIDNGALAGLGVSLGYQYQVKRSPWYVFDGSANSLPDYFRADGGISYRKDKIGFNLVINNLFNKYLYSGAPYTWGGYYYWQAEPGRNARLSINYRF